ncbi:MAG: polysaccharide pyruvyl transferase family protein, partial [Candidatus Atribacteria bacterium]|nr:polysaccharide pyruvyl transferase family protein [Candidatus Atribacteria bacterium]
IRRWSTAWLAYQVRRRVLRRPPTAPFERMVDEAAATLSIGGDNYSLDYGWPVSFFETNEIVLKRLKPLVLWGASVGPFTKDHEFEKCAAEQLKRVTLILARESETVAYLAALGVQENVRAVSDPAFVLEPEPVILPEPQQRILQTPCIGLNISPLLARFRQGGDSWQDRAAACVRALLESVDLPVLLIPHVVTEGSNNDFHFMKGIAENLASFRNRLFLVGPQYAAPQLKWIIGQCSVFVGARTHATIAALSLGVPTVSIGYSMKARGINKDLFGHTDWLLPIDQLKRSSIAEAVERLLDKADDVRYHLATIMPAYKLRARAAAKYLREVLQNT